MAMAAGAAALAVEGGGGEGFDHCEKLIAQQPTGALG
jgi:hypothetical protein